MDKKNFFAEVYEVVKLVPKGRVTSFGAIAAYLGAKSSARVVGWAMSGAAQSADVPAHRVVNRIGLLTGRNHFGTPTRMQELLESEGLVIIKDQVQDFEQHFWDPREELL